MESNKQVILFQRDEVALGYKYKLENPLTSDIKILSIDYDLENMLEDENIKILGPKPKENSLYYLHPYKKNNYIHESLEEDYFLKEKMTLFKKIAQDLGAKKIEIEVVQYKQKKRDIDAKGSAEYKFIKIKSGVHDEKINKYKQSFKIEEEFEIQENFDIGKNIDYYKGYIKEHFLEHETDLISLIESRDSRKMGSLLKKSKIHSEITHEYNRLVEISVGLISPVFQLDSNFSKKIEELNQVEVDITFEF